MSSTVNHPPEKSYWHGKSLQQRQRWTDKLFIEHPQIKRILKDFNQKLDFCERSGKFEAMLIVGGTGVGKTTLTSKMAEIAEARFIREDIERTIRPSIQFAIPDPCTPYELSVTILRSLGEEQPRARKNRADTISAAEKLIKDCEVKLVLLDNVQDIPERRGTRGVEMVGARLRNLIDASGALWVFLGTMDANKVINSDEQLIRRVPYRTKLDYFDIKNDDQKSIFIRLLMEIDKWLPLTSESCLHESSQIGTIYAATEGIFNKLIQLVDRAWFEAFQEAREEMQNQDLEKAFRYVNACTNDDQNPFSEKFVIRNLRGVNEPFEKLRGGIDAHTSTNSK